MKNLKEIELEVEIVKNDILNTIFCDYDNFKVPTYFDLVNADKFLSHWQLSEEYEDYSLGCIKNKVDELCENFFTTLEVLNSHKENVKKQKTIIEKS
jgi:hypothetical protein